MFRKACILSVALLPVLDARISLRDRVKAKKLTGKTGGTTTPSSESDSQRVDVESEENPTLSDNSLPAELVSSITNDAVIETKDVLAEVENQKPVDMPVESTEVVTSGDGETLLELSSEAAPVELKSKTKKFAVEQSEPIETTQDADKSETVGESEQTIEVIPTVDVSPIKVESTVNEPANEDKSKAGGKVKGIKKSKKNKTKKSKKAKKSPVAQPEPIEITQDADKSETKIETDATIEIEPTIVEPTTEVDSPVDESTTEDEPFVAPAVPVSKHKDMPMDIYSLSDDKAEAYTQEIEALVNSIQKALPTIKALPKNVDEILAKPEPDNSKPPRFELSEDSAVVVPGGLQGAALRNLAADGHITGKHPIFIYATYPLNNYVLEDSEIDNSLDLVVQKTWREWFAETLTWAKTKKVDNRQEFHSSINWEGLQPLQIGDNRIRIMDNEKVTTALALDRNLHDVWAYSRQNVPKLPRGSLYPVTIINRIPHDGSIKLGPGNKKRWSVGRINAVEVFVEDEYFNVAEKRTYLQYYTGLIKAAGAQTVRLGVSAALAGTVFTLVSWYFGANYAMLNIPYSVIKYISDHIVIILTGIINSAQFVNRATSAESITAVLAQLEKFKNSTQGISSTESLATFFETLVNQLDEVANTTN